jgi:hypothetical protein
MKKTDDEIRLIFSKLPPPKVKWRGSVGPFDWFLEGFRKAEAEAEKHAVPVDST